MPRNVPLSSCRTLLAARNGIDPRPRYRLLLFLERHRGRRPDHLRPRPCKMGLEGIVSKRKDSAYRSGRSRDWLKMKNANAPAVKREAEEEWGRP